MRDRVQEIFHALADLSAEDRNGYFDVHSVDPETRSEVIGLLEFESSFRRHALDRDIAHLARHGLARLRPAEPCFADPIASRGSWDRVAWAPSI